MTLSLAASENVGGMHAAIADRLAAEDDARRDWLNRMVHGGGRCRYCGTKVSDQSLDRAPGVCGHPGCQRKGRRDAIEARKLNHDNVPAAPAEGAEMPKGKRSEPWPCCGSKSFRHMKGCAKAAAKRETKAPEADPKAARVETIRRAVAKVKRETPAQAAGLTEMSVAELLEFRDQVQGELERREKELGSQLAAIREARAVAA